MSQVIIGDLLGTHPIEMRLPKLLFSQQTVVAELWRPMSPRLGYDPHEHHVPRVSAADANDSDGGTCEADLDVGTEHNPQKAEDERRDRVVRLDDLVAALDGAGVARACVLASNGCGGRKGRGGEGGDDGDAGEHG